MKILFVDMQYDYGKKKYGRNIIGQDGFLKSFENLRHTVETFYYDDYLGNNMLLDKLQVDLIKKADDFKPDMVFTMLFTNQFQIKTLDYLKSKYITVGWFGDDQWRFDNYSYKYAAYFTYCVTTDKFSIKKYKKLGQQNIIGSQWAAIDTHEIPKFNGYKYDVTFVGRYHPYRKWFIDTLVKRDIKIEVFGNGWPNGVLTNKQMNELFVSSKINLNISNSNSFDIRYLKSSWKAIPLLLKSKKNMSQVKARNFEIPYFGGFQLTDYVPSLGDYFDIGREVVCYKDIDEAELLIRYYLDNDQKRETIKNLSHKRAVAEHGYINRLDCILKNIDRLKDL
jgi:spore maturation protein CgeB